MEFVYNINILRGDIMSNFRFSTFVLEMLGSSKQDAKLVRNLGNQYNNRGVVLSEHKLASNLRHGGLSAQDRAHAECFNSEFGHINSPWLYTKTKKF
jgi:hypothetical protein